MPTRRKPLILARKRPRQDRSQHLVQAILEAAIRVLAREGARRFTTVRVADQAGVSEGSLYQYFPNKESILFKLQADEWSATSRILASILADSKLPPPERLRKLVVVFFMSELDEAPFRVALADAAPLYRNAPEALRLKREQQTLFQAFIAEALPRADAPRREFCADLVMTTIGAVGEKLSEQQRSAENIEQLAAGVGDMLCAFLDSIDRRRGAHRKSSSSGDRSSARTRAQ